MSLATTITAYRLPPSKDDARPRFYYLARGDSKGRLVSGSRCSDYFDGLSEAMCRTAAQRATDPKLGVYWILEREVPHG